MDSRDLAERFKAIQDEFKIFIDADDEMDDDEDEKVNSNEFDQIKDKR